MNVSPAMMLVAVVAAMAAYLFMNRSMSGNVVVTQNMMLVAGAALLAVGVYAYMKQKREGISVQGLGESRDVVLDGPSRFTIESTGHNPNMRPN